MFTTEQAASELGLTPSTFKRRASQFGIGNTLKRNKAYWPDDALQAMKLACELLADGRGNDTIKRTLHPVQSETERNVDRLGHGSVSVQAGASSDQLRAIIRDELVQQNDLAVRFSQATYRVGELEAEARGLHAKIAEQAEQIKLLSAPKAEPEQPAGFMAWLKRIFG